MRSILENAIVHLLNQDNDKAEALFHKFMVERARQIHESLRQGEDIALNEGWDDEMASESYMGEDDDLGDVDVADDDFAAHDDEMAADDHEMAADDLDGDLGGDDMGGDPDMDPDLDGGDMGGMEQTTDEKIDGIKDAIDALTAEFEAMMDKIGDDDVEDFGDDEDADFGDTSSEGDEGADDNLDTSETDSEFDGPVEDEEEEPAEDDVMEDTDLDDITESVIADLEKITMTDKMTDGEEVGSGKKFKQNTASPLPMKSVSNRNDAKPVKTSQDEHNSFEREPSPAVKPVNNLVNTSKTKTGGPRKKFSDDMSEVKVKR